MGKHIVTRICILRLLFFAILCTSVSRAAEINIPYLKCEIRLSKNKIVSGEPVSLCFGFTNISDGLVTVSFSDSYDIYDPNAANRLETEKLKISVQDSHGNEIARRHLLCRPHSQILMFREQIDPGETVFADYPLHLRVSTLLAPGTYSVTVKSYGLGYGCEKPWYPKSACSGVRVLKLDKGTFSGPALALEVEARDDRTLQTCYEKLMEIGSNAAISRSTFIPGYDYFNIVPPFRTLLWAEGASAVPYQISLIYDPERGFRFWPPAIVNTWDNIVRYATPEQIESVLEIARHPACVKDPDKEYSSHYTPGLAWAIHQWNTNGPESIKEKTKDLVQQFPYEDPCPKAMEQGQRPYGWP